LLADELILSFVPSGEQRIWGSMTRMKLQLTRYRVRLQNQIECLLEEMRIKLSIVVSNLLGASGLRILGFGHRRNRPREVGATWWGAVAVHGGATGRCSDGPKTAVGGMKMDVRTYWEKSTVRRPSIWFWNPDPDST
jgi:hypothetical protein